MKSMSMLKLVNVFVTFNPGTAIENRALRGLNLSIKKGEFVTVIGSNGAGKSTLLNAISGDISVEMGDIYIAGVKVNESDTCERSASVARVFQDPLAGSCDALSVEENMALAMMRGEDRGLKFALNKKRREFLKNHLRTLNLGIENRMTDRMGLLSGGQRQAVSLLIASIKKSEILLLDEHTAALDPKAATEVLTLTNRIVKEGSHTALMVTHSMRQALDYGTRTIMLHEGRVIFDFKEKERHMLEVSDLMRMFEKASGRELTEDNLLLNV